MLLEVLAQPIKYGLAHLESAFKNVIVVEQTGGKVMGNKLCVTIEKVFRDDSLWTVESSVYGRP
jgi:hypothetical protein